MKLSTISSVAQIKVNFMKDEAKINELGSRAYNRTRRDGSIEIVAELVDGLNLRIDTTEGQIDATSQLVNTTVNVRFAADVFESLNERMNELEGVGAYIEFNVDGSVSTGMLTVNGIETLSLTIYAIDVVEVTPLLLQRVGTTMPQADIFAAISAQKVANAERSQAAIAQNRAARVNTPVLKDAAKTELAF